MKNCLLLFLTLLICNFTYSQVPDISLTLTDNFCDEPDIVAIEFAATNLVGTYNYVSTDLNCITGELTGTVEITQDPNDETIFFVEDFSFGLFGACIGIDPPSGNLNWRYENFVITWNGSDNYGETYNFETFSANGNDWTFMYSNTYGDMATVKLTRVDGQDLPYATTDPAGGANPNLSILWNTGDTTPSIEITANGNYSVTVSDNNGGQKIADIGISDWNEPHPDLDALRDIYKKSMGSNWTNNDGWRQAFDQNDGCNPCSGDWFGIECEENRVISLELSDNNLDGRISVALGFIENIEIINLSNNKLSGSIPIHITSGLPLKELDLSRNLLFGQFPTSVTSIASLESLDISRNAFVETIPTEIGDLNVRYLNLSQNQFVGEIPKQLGQIKQLLNFSASSNQLTGEIPKELFELPALAAVSLSNNFLTGPLPENVASPNLEQISIANNNLTGMIPDSYSTLPIFRLDLGYNNLEGEVPNFTNIGTFILDFILAGNQFEGDLPAMPAGVRIINFDLSFNNFSGQIPTEYSELTTSRFNLSHNNLTGTIPEELQPFDVIRLFDLSHNNLTGQIPMFLGSIENPNLIDLSHNDLEGCYPMMDSLCVLGYSSIDTTVSLNNGQSYSLDFQQGYDFTNNPKLPWSGDATNLCNGDNQIGAPCDDGDANTTNDGIVDDCSCDQRLSIHEINGQILTVYPNPATHVLNIEIAENTNLKAQLFNSTGQVIKQLGFNVSNNISELSSGIYILEIVDKVKNISIIERIVVE